MITGKEWNPDTWDRDIWVFSAKNVETLDSYEPHMSLQKQPPPPYQGLPHSFPLSLPPLTEDNSGTSSLQDKMYHPLLRICSPPPLLLATKPVVYVKSKDNPAGETEPANKGKRLHPEGI